MKFSIERSIEILERTPVVLASYLKGMPEEWVKNNEGKNTWSPYDIVGHLIIGEKTDWIVRAKIILSDAENKWFEPFDRFAQLESDQTRSIDDLLDEFKVLRAKNLAELTGLKLTKDDFQQTGVHPELGNVRLKELMATWTVHDLGHIAQISRVMAKQYKDEVGPWAAYLGILK